MKNYPIFIQAINQKDNFTFTIHWSDNTLINYRLSDIQKTCPCAKCFDHSTGKQRIQNSDIDQEVKALSLNNVGRYALKIEFTSGCSLGIYSYDRLHKTDGSL